MTDRLPTAVLDFDVANPRDFFGLSRYGNAQVLCRLHGRPLATVWLAVNNGAVRQHDVTQALLDRGVWPFALACAERRLANPRYQFDNTVDALFFGRPDCDARPLVTVAVCTRDRVDDLRQCLDALGRSNYERLDVVVVDNAPSTDATQRLVEDEYPRVRYVREPRPGLDWARNRAIIECRGDILAYTDDDVIVDADWVSALVRVFAADPEVMAVTGLVIPHELETSAQRMFERYGGFGRGFRRQWYRAPRDRSIAALHGGAGKFGTGANMAFRRSVFETIGGFDPALDVGTCTNGGGDLEMFFRVLKFGHTLVYEPAAMVRHRHRRSYEALRTQITNNGIGFYSYLVRCARTYRDERLAMLLLGLWWLRWWHARRLVRALLRKETIPLDLIFAELVGVFRGLPRYSRARARAASIAAAHPGEPVYRSESMPPAPGRRLVPEAVRLVDLSQPLVPISDVAGYDRVRVIVAHGDVPIGAVTIDHHGGTVSTAWLSDAISQALAIDVLAAREQLGRPVVWARLLADLSRAFHVAGSADRNPTIESLPDDVAVSVVIATYDRPADLRRCLQSVMTQRSPRPLEVIVVDNHPASGLTAPVVDEFPCVRLIEEHRAGLSYARNAGIVAATGHIIVATDDDVTCPPDWIERLVAPFAQSGVMVVTGNVLPAVLDSDAERMFEAYGGLGRGYTPCRVDHDWFERWRRAVPTWKLGCTANAAFRASVFSDPAIGLMDEALGPGTPTGVGEDTYVFYRVLKAGHAIVYEPRAYVWHRHRSTMAALRKQIYAYSKGHVAYHLTTCLRDGDLRGLVRVLYELPVTHARRIYHRLRGWNDYPMRLLALEILGNLAGPYGLWKSRRRVRALGKSRRLAPPASTPIATHNEVAAA